MSPVNVYFSVVSDMDVRLLAGDSSVMYLLRLLPCQLRNLHKAVSHRACFVAGRSTASHACTDSMQNRGETEHIERDVVVKIRDPRAPGAPAIGCNVAFLIGQP